MAEKIAITVDRDLLAKVEAMRHRTGESRSAVFGRALRMLMATEESRRKVERYMEAYREQPEDEAELAQAEALARWSLEAVEWEA